MEILSVKLIKDKKDKEQKCLTVGYKHPTKNKKIATYEVEYPDFVHEDLIKALKGLIPHFCLMIEEVNQDEIDDIADYTDPLFEHFRVTSFSIAGKDEDPGITITGYKVLTTGRSITINSPFFKLNQSEEEGYPFMPQFEQALKHLKEEVQQYIDGNKYAPDPQLDMFPEGEKITGAQIAEPLTEEEKVLEKLSRENLPKIPQADPEAMGRVAAMKNTPSPKRTGKKK